MKKLFLRLGPCLLAFICLSISALQAKPADDFLKSAKQFLSAGKFAAAASECTKATEHDPKSAEAYQLRGWILFYLGKPQSAFADLNMAIKLNPKRYENYTARGEINRQLAHYDESRKDLDLAIKLDPKRPDAYYLRGLSCLLQGLHVRARKDFSDAISRGKGNHYLGFAYYWRGRTEEMQEDYKAAVDDFSVSITMDPDRRPSYDVNPIYLATDQKKRPSALGLLERGLCYTQLGEHGKAIDDLSVVIKATPKETLLYEKRGYEYLSLGRFNEALKDFNTALLKGAESGDVYFNLGLAHFCLRKYENASSDFSAWLERTFWDDNKTALAASLNYLSYKALKLDARAVRFSDEAAKGMAKADDWTKAVPFVLKGKTSPEQLVALTDKLPIKEKTKAHCYAGLYLLSQSKPKEASKHFNWISRQGDRKSHEYTVSEYEVKTLGAQD